MCSFFLTISSHICHFYPQSRYCSDLIWKLLNRLLVLKQSNNTWYLISTYEIIIWDENCLELHSVRNYPDCPYNIFCIFIKKNLVSNSLLYCIKVLRGENLPVLFVQKNGKFISFTLGFFIFWLDIWKIISNGNPAWY